MGLHVFQKQTFITDFTCVLILTWISLGTSQRVDTYTESVPMNASFKIFLQGLVWSNSDLPDICRNDICFPILTESEYRGDILWPHTPVGQRRFMACPHAQDKNIIYASQVCALENGNSTWHSFVNKECPIDPLHIYVVSEVKLYNNTGNLSDIAKSYDKILHGMAETVNKYPEKRLLKEDCMKIQNFLQHFLMSHLHRGEKLNTSLMSSFLTVVDHLMGPGAKQAVWELNKAGEKPYLNLWYLLAVVARYTTLNEEAGIWSRQLPNICLHIWTTATPIASQNFSCPFSETETVATTPHFDHGLTQTALLMINPASTGGGYLLDEGKLQNTPPNQNTQQRNGTSAEVTQLDLSSSEHVAILDEYSPQDLPLNPKENKEVTLFTANLLYVSMQHVDQMTGDVTEVQPASMDVYMSYLKVLQDPESMCVGDSRNTIAANLMEMVSEENINWSENGCYLVSEKRRPTPNTNRIHCQCNVTGFLGAFIQGKYKSDIFKTSSRPPPSGLSFFLGFPYKKELFIAGHVMRAMSLICLVLTITSYARFKNTRHGKPTWILLHLCVSLIALLVALYVSEAIIGTKNGCRVASGMRLYLILVSLMWNGVEAVNMYLMLVKVFNINISHFVLKTAILAWGLPAVWVLLIPVVNISAFDGHYVDCQFRCVLPRDTLYFGFLLPMCVIIFNNVVVFILVMRVLKDHGSRSHDEHRRHWWVQLCGAITMLVLLGVPWIFSVFGVIDTRVNQELALLAGIFQVIFVVFVDLQGIFIFIFNCARIKEVRRHWLAAVSGSNIPTSDIKSTPTHVAITSNSMKIMGGNKSSI